jgi:hypothetical protein
MKRSLAIASGVALAALTSALAWFLIAGAQVAAGGGPNPILVRTPLPGAPPPSTTTAAVTVIFVLVLVCMAVAVALVQRSADRAATRAEVRTLTARHDHDDQEHKAA